MVDLQTAPSPRIVEAQPSLENGETLRATEFLRRYEAMPESTKAQLIQGTVYIMPPVSLEHGEPDNMLQMWLGVYAVGTPGVKSATNTTTKLSPDDVPQPDGLLRILPEYGGQSRSEKYLLGAPELGVEIAFSSTSLDVNAKKTSYRRAGMQEYLVWRTRQRQIDWWRLVDDDYQLIEPDENGLLKSHVFQGLWLDPAALVDDDGLHLLEVLKQGMASAEHAAFVERLAKTREDLR